MVKFFIQSNETVGLDLVCIIKNKYTKKEITAITDFIDSWSDIHLFVDEYRRNSNEHTYLEPFPSRWSDGKINEEILEKLWQFNESNGKIRLEKFLGSTNLETHYLDLQINRNSIIIFPSPEHKYANLQNPIVAQYIITLIRKVALKFGQAEIIYCVDSMFPPARIYQNARAGMEYNELIEFGIKEMGMPPIEFNEALKNLFFVDNINTQIPNVFKWDWSDFRWKDY